MYMIRKEFSFASAHQLNHLPEGHPCRNLHGHTYKAVVELRSNELDKETQMVLDFRELKFVQNTFDKNYDHNFLNDSFEFTTSEWMSREIYKQLKQVLPQLWAVEIHESPKTMARYSPYENVTFKMKDDNNKWFIKKENQV